MTHNEMNIALAKLCGNKVEERAGKLRLMVGNIKGEWVCGPNANNYLTDLNLMRQAEEHITDWPKYVKTLAKVIAGWPHGSRATGLTVRVDASILIRAEAQQRAVAVLVTLGIFKKETPKNKRKS